MSALTNPRVETIAIGDEVISGRISDTNSSYVSESLLRHGLWIVRHNAVGDDIDEIIDLLTEVSSRADFGIVFGGLGPTSDDKTVEAVAKLLKTSIIEHEESKRQLLAHLQKRGRSPNVHTLKQALYPEDSEPLLNQRGLAPGFAFTFGRCKFYCLPGVPYEMKGMFDEAVIPQMVSKPRSPLLIRTWRCFGIPESELQVLMTSVENLLPPDFWLGYRTRPPENHLTLYGRMGWDTKITRLQLENLKTTIRERLASYCFTEESKELELLVIDELVLRKLRLAVAESCTGGLVAHRLTSVSGSSAVFFGGMTVYQVTAKSNFLGLHLPSDELSVSQECSRELAVRLLRLSGVELAASVTGYMGPSGGTLTDPIGTLYLSIVGAKEHHERIQMIPKDRALNLYAASAHVLYRLLTILRQD